jgi:hypothetical protein
LVEEGEIDRVLAEAGEEEIAEGIAATGEVDGIGAIEEVEAAISSGADPDSADSSSKESIADMAITVPILTIYRTATNSPMEDWQIHRSKKGRGRTTIHGRGSSRDLQHQTIPERLNSCGTVPSPF